LADDNGGDTASDVAAGLPAFPQAVARYTATAGADR
jgi:hypothetical protein